MGAYNVVSRAAMAAGQPEDISVVLANLDAIATVLNGGIDNSNINGAAAILASKLAGYPADVTKLLRGDGTWAQLLDAQVAAAAAIGRPKLERNITQLVLSAPQSIPNAAGTAIIWDQENVDDQNQHPAGANDSITLTRAGLFLIVFNMVWANVAGGDRLSAILVNGTSMGGQAGPRDLIFGTGLQTTSYVGVRAAGDVIKALVEQTTGGALNTGSGAAAGPTLTVVQL